MSGSSPLPPNLTSPVSLSKRLADFTAIPSNRSCADCRVTLIDSSQVYASYSPPLEVKPPTRYNHFAVNHARFAPPHLKVPEVLDPPIDPSLQAAERMGGHGVLVCALCAAAHKLLGPSIALVHAVQDKTSWNSDNVAVLVGRGGNTRARKVLEAYCPEEWHRRRPNTETSIAERLVFVRAKYEALAFLLPPAGPLSQRAWRGIVDRHADEWDWSVDLKLLSQLNLQNSYQFESQHVSSRNLVHEAASPANRSADLPNRLVDYFCVVEGRKPQTFGIDWTGVNGPENIPLVPEIIDCYPAADLHHDMEFPSHLGPLVFPLGCHPASTPLPPSFFTFVLTGADGVRLYGGVLQINDDTVDIDSLASYIRASDYDGSFPKWLEGQPDKEMGINYMPKALVVISHYPFFDLWRKFLLRIYRIALIESPLPMERFIANFCCEVPLPPPGRVQVKFGFSVKETWNIERPPENRLPMANFSFLPLFGSLSVGNILVVIGCLLQEARVALLSQHIAILTPVAETLLSLMFPFHWQGMYLPVCPFDMKDVLSAPVPFLIGLHSKYLKEVPVSEHPREVVFVDLDKDVVYLGEDDSYNVPRKLPSLPERKIHKLKTRIDEMASSVYVPPDGPTSSTATIMKGCTGDFSVLPESERQHYARTTKRSATATGFRRRDVFGAVDKAYGENELLVPITGFFSEQGHLYENATPMGSGETSRRSKVNLFQKKKNGTSMVNSFSSKHSSNGGSGSFSPGESSVSRGLLSLEEPSGFSTAVVRDVFLRFFLSIFRSYRQYLGTDGFRGEEFLQSLNLSADQLEFCRCVIATQFFARFLNERAEIPDDAEILFFDESINAKLNRSKKAAIANLRGGKRPTNFIDDTSMNVQETFTPPPPSHWGLPDDGKIYHYGSFPKLNQNLFGKTREPMAWPSIGKRMPQRTSRRASGLAQANERAFFARTLHSVDPRNLVKVTKRGARGLESAIGALSIPFVPQPEAPEPVNLHAPTDDLSSNRLSSVTLPSTIDLFQEELTTAEEIVLNARRKQAILIGIVVKLQSLCRAHLVRRQRHQTSILQSSLSRDTESTTASIAITTWLRAKVPCYQARKQFLQLRKATKKLQAQARSSPIRGAYLSLIYGICYFQALVRGAETRRKVQRVAKSRLALYRRLIFSLWQKEGMTLSYRSTFWPLLDTEGAQLFARLNHAEDEIDRLSERQVPRSRAKQQVTRKVYETVLEASAALGMNTRVLSFSSDIDFAVSLKAEENGASAVSSRTSFLRRSSISGGPSVDVLTSERSCVYDALSVRGKLTPNEFAIYCNKLGVSEERKKKAALADALWKEFSHVDASIELLNKLFTNLSKSGIPLNAPSKKAIKRFRLSPSGRTLHRDPLLKLGNVDFSERIRRNNTEVANLGLNEIPKISQRLVRLEEKEFQRKISRSKGRPRMQKIFART